MVGILLLDHTQFIVLMERYINKKQEENNNDNFNRKAKNYCNYFG